MIRNTPKGWVVVSESGGKRLSKPGTLAAAKKRLGQIEFFKHKGGK